MGKQKFRRLRVHLFATNLSRLSPPAGVDEEHCFYLTYALGKFGRQLPAGENLSALYRTCPQQLFGCQNT